MGTATLLARPRAAQSNLPKVASVVALIDGHAETWRTYPTVCDPDLDYWEAHALDDGRQFARLLTRDLARLHTN